MQKTYKMNSLFGLEPLEVVTSGKKKIAKALDVIEEEVDKEDLDNDAISKLLKSDKTSRAEKVALVENRIIQVLGKQQNNILCITDKNELHEYVSAAIASGRIDIDTETNNSLDPLTCLLMGGCLYYPGAKPAYIPVNHVDIDTDMRLQFQLTEADLKEEFERIVTANKLAGLEIIMHNGKFDYEVICCTTGVKVSPTWDTLVGWRLLDENDDAGLKYIYTKYIDPTQVKYDLGSLCETIPYAWLNPKIFALYAAMDALMTDKVYLIEKPKFEQPGNEKLYNLFKTVEMPIVTITAEMEMTGVYVDVAYGERLSIKYNKLLADIDKKLEGVFDILKPTIDKWRLTTEATAKARYYEPKSTIRSRAEIEAEYIFEDEKLGKRYKLGKPKAEQLPEQINFASASQLAILFYDILKCKPFSDAEPRGTGEEAVESLKGQLKAKAKEVSTWNGSSKPSAKDELMLKQLAAPYTAAAELCALLLDRRGIVKLLTTYIDTIPKLAKHWPDGRVRAKFNSTGTDTGRYSSGGKVKYMDGYKQVVVSGINMQNIPSRASNIRLLFKAQTTAKLNETDESSAVTIFEYEEVETTTGWKYPKDLVVNEDLVISDEGNVVLKTLDFNAETRQYRLGF